MSLIPQSIRNLIGPLATSSNKASARFRVDVSQTSFWEGRDFRIFPPIDTSGGQFCIKIEAAVDFILHWQALVTQSNIIDMKAYRLSDGGVESGTFTPTIYHLPSNSMQTTPAYTKQVIYSTGGTWTPTDPNLYRDKLHVTTSNATAQQSTVGASSTPERGLPPDTYYLVFTGGGIGDFYSIIEERPGGLI